jgi:septum formation protein
MKRRFVLASSSPRRRELLALLGLNFITIAPNIDESQHPGEAPLDYVQRLSKEKAGNVALEVTQPLVVLAADTIVILDGEVLGKPIDAAAARTMLRRLRGRVHQVCTAITLIDFGGGSEQRITDMALSDVHMRNYSDEEIEAYIATGDPFDKAGGYAVQHEGFHPVDHIDGSYTNVVGLPLEVMRRLLSEIGWEVESLPQSGPLGGS